MSAADMCICRPGHMGDPDCPECCGPDPATCPHPDETRHFTRTVGMYDRYVCGLCATIFYADAAGDSP